MAQPASLEGLGVAVQSGDEILRKENAHAVRVSEVSNADQPAAAPEWRLRKLGLRVTRFELFEKTHVMALAPGENGWLKRLQEFLQDQQWQMAALLEKSPERE